MTPTSETGSDGFTLVELLVVVVILGLAGSMVVLAVPEPRPSLARESQDLAAVLIQTRDQAVLTNRAGVVEVDGGGYRAPDRAGRWARGNSIGIAGADGVVRQAAALSFDPTGLADPAAITLRREGRTASVRIDQAGQVDVDAAR